MIDLIGFLDSISPSNATLIGATLATTGWVYTARKGRWASRKQHTLNVMVQARFNKDFKDAEKAVSPTDRKVPIDISLLNCPNREDFKVVLNYYEFLAAGIRNGDFDEKMVMDSLRGTILTLYEACEEGIFKVRTNRRRQALYEHLEWLHHRWEKSPPALPQRLIERLRAKPFSGERKKH